MLYSCQLDLATGATMPSIGYCKHRMEGYVFFITYEEMKQDTGSVERRLANFMGETITSKGMETIVKHSTLDVKKTYAQIEDETTGRKISPKFYGVSRHVQKSRVKKFIDCLKNGVSNDDKIQPAANRNLTPNTFPLNRLQF
ncbi:hypothetical protein HOLleu_22218 [Holothuria leucospilota]|uniref:Sulfotransferase domain-containing protein n=1 Tax=Holothuria leucospilota TaxID=206669 RepID=A0A9Q1BYZ1_HOLLE|nr:hypothetical protein HOLleu_22218 [Holothuria leucospilota]